MSRFLALALLVCPTLALAQIEVPAAYRSQNVFLTDAPPQEPRTPESSVGYITRGTVPVPGNEVLELSRPRADYPAILAPQDFFGRVKRPSQAFHDPFNSSLTVDGKPSAPGDKPMIAERIRTLEVQPWDTQQISVAEEAWITLILLRDGELVYPRSHLVGSDKLVEVQRSAVKESPYLYLRARGGTTELNGSYLHTTVDIEVVDREQHVFVYKFDVQVVPLYHQTYYPTIKVNMVNSVLPPVYGREGSRFAEDTGTARSETVASRSRATIDGQFQPGSAAMSDGRKFTREDARKYLPIMIGMAKAYDDAIASRAKGYGPNKIMTFQPATIGIVGGAPTLVKGKIPAFRNPYDGQTYYVLRSYFFPQYDAILYDVSFRNTSDETLWWNYADLEIIPGFEASNRGQQPTVVTPELGETTPPQKINTLWVLVQGRGWDTNTPIRLSFPPRGMESRTPTLVLPHAESPKTPAQQTGISLFRRDTIDFSPSAAGSADR